MRLAYIALASNGQWHMVVDGAMGPGYQSIDPNEIVWGGNRLAYAAQKDGRHHAVIDHKPGPAHFSVQWLRVTPDGGHVAYIADKSVIHDGVARGPVFVNGPSPLEMAPDGRIAYMAPDGSLMVDGRGVSNTTLESLVFNPAGKGFACVQTVASSAFAAIIDGKQGLQYDKISGIQYSLDGRRSAYVGHKGVMAFPVVDGEELPGHNRVQGFRFSSDGKRYAYEAFKAGAFSVVVDGKQGPEFQSLEEGTLAFSPNGRHYVYGACAAHFQCRLMEDDKATTLPQVGRFQSRTARPALPFPPLLFSPDSGRLAYVAVRADGSGRSDVVVGGQTWLSASAFSFPAFSANGRHFATAAWGGNGWTVMVDSKAGPTYEDLVEASPAVFRFVDDRTLRFLAVKGGQVYRVVLTLDGD